MYYPPAKAELPERPFSHVARIRESMAVPVILYFTMLLLRMGLLVSLDVYQSGDRIVHAFTEKSLRLKALILR